MRNRTLTAATGALTIALTLAACGANETQTPPSDPGPEPTQAATPEPEPTTPAASPTTQAPEPPAADVGMSRDSPFQVGQTFEYGAWELTFEPTDTDAWPEIQQYQIEEWGDDESYHTPPPDGMNYVMTEVTATYIAEGSEDPAVLNFDYVGSAGNVYSDLIIMVDFPNDNLSQEVYTGASVTSNILQVVDAEQAEGGVWRIKEAYFDSFIPEMFVATQ